MAEAVIPQSCHTGDRALAILFSCRSERALQGVNALSIGAVTGNSPIDLSRRKREVDTVPLLNLVTHFPALDGYHSPCWGARRHACWGGLRAIKVGVVKG
jgi:hypothetical protein